MVIHAHTCVHTHLWVCTHVEMGTCVMDDFSTLLSCQSSAFSRNHTLHLGFARVLIQGRVTSLDSRWQLFLGICDHMH